jgi:hypothetical protein
MTESIHYLEVAIRVQFDPMQLPKILKIGRKLTQENIQIPVDDDDQENKSTRAMTDEEIAEEVRSVEDCIGEIIQANPLLDQLGMEVISSTVAKGQTATDVDDLPSLDLAVNHSRNLEPVESLDSEEDGEEPLDEFNDAGLFLCRWPNGDCSVVAALTKKDAIVQLDEWGAAEPHMPTPIERCMLDFELDESGDLQLKDLGEETRDVVYDTCYPDLSEFLTSEQLEPLHSNSASALVGSDPLLLSKSDPGAWS